MVKKLLKKVLKKIGLRKSPDLKQNPFGVKGTLKIRKYTTYEDYLHHQAEKLGKQYDNVKRYDLEYEKIIEERYKGKFEFIGKSMLCLAARLGGEVRGFKNLGALSIGIDLEPGEKNPHVLHGDFHNIQFASNSFDYIFTNAIDHVFDLDVYLTEVIRVLRPKGKFIIEFAEVKPGLYETLDTSSVKPVMQIINNYFHLIEKGPLVNKSSYANWSGYLLILEALEN